MLRTARPLALHACAILLVALSARAVAVHKARVADRFRAVVDGFGAVTD
jgi:hypothetical protein